MTLPNFLCGEKQAPGSMSNVGVAEIIALCEKSHNNLTRPAKPERLTYLSAECIIQ